MKFSREQAIIESMLFAAGREVNTNELMSVLEISKDDLIMIINSLMRV